MPKPLATWSTPAVLAGLCAGWLFACASDRGAFSDGGLSFSASDASLAEGGCGGLRCSSDLKSVEDGCGVVSVRCPPDQGCANGACVEACASAAANQGSIGCAFWAVPPSDDPRVTGDSCYAASIANTWDKPVTITADYDGSPLDLSRSIYTFAEGSSTLQPLEGALPPAGVAVVLLSQGPGILIDSSFEPHFIACPQGTTAALDQGPSVHGAAKTKAIHLQTDVPVSAYTIFPFGGALSYAPTATLLLPTPSWDNNYIAVDPWEKLTDLGQSFLAYSPFIQIVADADDTTVRIRPTVDIIDGAGFTGGARGLVTTFTLQRGEVLQLVQPEELTGSAIETTLPVGVFGGHGGMFLPSDVGFADIAQQQIPPVAQWGSRYALVPHRSRYSAGVDGVTRPPENVPWRLVGAAAGTKLHYDPIQPIGAPDTLDAGQTVVFWSKEAVVVESQDPDHAFYAAAYMTGADYVKTGTGDPEFVNVIPVGQFLDRYVLVVDSTYPDSWIDVVRARTPNGFADVTLDCVGALSGWVDVGSAGDLQSVSVTMRKGQGALCNEGGHEMKSSGHFAATVWGIGPYASYAYPGGAGSRRISNVVVPVK